MEADGPCFAFLEVIDDPVPRTGPLNMALDESLLASIGDAAILRFYDWSEPTVSFGYFEPSAAARHLACGRPVVRRWTGGGIVEHGGDLTYSLCVPRSHPFAAWRSAESYRRVHDAVAAALVGYGIAAEHQMAMPTPATGEPNTCFEHPVPHDLVAGGRKVAGGAQRRNRAGLLHQGSVQVHLTRPQAFTTWRRAMCRELPAALSERREERELTPQLFSAARTLATAKYAASVWTDRF